MMQYITEEMMRKHAFPYIQKQLANAEAAPDYEREPNGMSELRKVLEFVQQDLYYPTFEEKAAYLLCSIAASQYFSNGNKRLSVMTLVLFLSANAVIIDEDSVESYKNILQEVFPLHVWEHNAEIKSSHALFLYNLAALLGDRTKWGTNDFPQVRERVATIFRHLYIGSSD
jgi:prophage maintenance system killer protein